MGMWGRTAKSKGSSDSALRKKKSLRDLYGEQEELEKQIQEGKDRKERPKAPTSSWGYWGDAVIQKKKSSKDLNEEQERGKQTQEREERPKEKKQRGERHAELSPPSTEVETIVGIFPIETSGGKILSIYEIPLIVTLEDIYSGCHKKMMIRRNSWSWDGTEIFHRR